MAGVGGCGWAFRLKAALRSHPCPFVFICGFLLVAFCVVAPLSLAADRYGSHTAAEFTEHVRELKKKLPGDDFTIVVAPPFVVIGDDEPAEVRRRAKNTVGWAVEKLKAAYFTQRPDGHPRHLALQGQGELRGERRKALPQRSPTRPTATSRRPTRRW